MVVLDWERFGRERVMRGGGWLLWVVWVVALLGWRRLQLVRW